MKTKDILIRNVPITTAQKFRKIAKRKGVFQAKLLTEMVELSTPE